MGVSPVPGLFFVGVPWQRTRASSIIDGGGPDATFIAERIAGRELGGADPPKVR